MLHRPASEGHCPWSLRFDHIFRNEEVVGSNPASSTSESTTKWPDVSALRSTRGQQPRVLLRSPRSYCSAIATPESLLGIDEVVVVVGAGVELNPVELAGEPTRICAS